MGNLFERGTEAVRHERAILSLIDGTTVPGAEVRKLFASEYARLALDASVRAHLQTLTVANVREILRRLDAAPHPAV